jgi:phytoene desaturase
MTEKKAAVIGAGIAGIAVAIRLANQGYEVTVFEANPYIGGKLSEFEHEGYRFDAGPSLFTMPQLVDELFRLSGEDPVDYFHYKQLEEVCRYFYEDGTILHAWGNKYKFAQEVEEKTGEPGEKILNFLKRSGKYYDIVGTLFLYKSLNKISTFFNTQALKAVVQLPQLGIFTTMSRANEQYFSSPKVVQLFNRFATYNGSDPYQTPALLNIIPHLEHNIGAFFPLKGMHSITDSLGALARRKGVTFRTNCPVDEILVQDKMAKGVKVKGAHHYFDLVISNMDVVNTYSKLLPDEPKPRKILEQPKSSSALIFYWGISREFKELSLHNILFSNDYKLEFEHIFRQQSVYSDPTVYINITSKHKPDDAPPGCENWFIMINVPNNSGQDWSKIIADARENISRKISRMLGTDINRYIACEAILDPISIEERTSSSQGALYGNSSNNRYAAFLRHSNKSKSIKNLYFCGGSVHPGGGIPLSLLSGKITADLVAAQEEETLI